MNYRAVAAVTMAILIGGGLYFYKTPELPPEPADKNSERTVTRKAGGVGIIDIEKIQAAHPEGARLEELKARELRLRLELNEAMKISALPKIPPPETNAEAFDETVWQKNAQVVVSQFAELEAKKKSAREEYRKKTEPRYIEERNKIREQYLNENFNIQLKLQNKDNLHLTDEQIDELRERLEEVELERNRVQKELLDKWTAEIEQYVKDLTAAEEARLHAESERLRAEVEEQARKKESDVTERNRQLMEESLREVETRQNRRRELFTELNEVGRERAQLEKEIFDSIVDKATMLAAVNRLEMIFVKRKPDVDDKILSRRIDWNFDLKKPEGVGAAIFPGKNARDLTDELIKEMNRL